MNTKRKIYLTLIVSLLVIIGLWLFLIQPLVDEVKLLSTEFEQKNNLLASYKDKGEKYLNKLRDDYNLFESRIFEINNSFIDSEKVIDSILAVEQAAVSTSNYQEIKEISSPGEDNALSFQISLWGSFPNLVKFLARIENLNYFIDSDSLQITRIGERDLRSWADKGINISDGDVKSTLEIKAYAKN